MKVSGRQDELIVKVIHGDTETAIQVQNLDDLLDEIERHGERAVLAKEGLWWVIYESD